MNGHQSMLNESIIGLFDIFIFSFNSSGLSEWPLKLPKQYAAIKCARCIIGDSEVLSLPAFIRIKNSQTWAVIPQRDYTQTVVIHTHKTVWRYWTYYLYVNYIHICIEVNVVVYGNLCICLGSKTEIYVLIIIHVKLANGNCY